MTKKIIYTCDMCGKECMNDSSPMNALMEGMEGFTKIKYLEVYSISYKNNDSPFLNTTVHFCGEEHLFDYMEKAKESKNDNK